MLVLGIETSCDETAAAVVADGSKVLSSVVSSQVDVHASFGGIVPELASRAHTLNIIPVVDEALREAGKGLDDIDLVAVTMGPGLIGALLVGVSAAKSLAYSAGKPLVGVNHIEGHLSAIFLEDDTVEFPFVLLIVSGGHTHLYRVSDCCAYEKLGQTRDDAAGEAYDKVAKLLGLGYPGGPIIDGLSRQGDGTKHKFPRARLGKDSLDFSFSGLKTAVMLRVKELGGVGAIDEQEMKDLCASFQEAVVDVLVEKTVEAVRKAGVKRIVVGGGVAANGALRVGLADACGEAGISLHMSSPDYCTDNAAMIAAAGYRLYRSGRVSGLDLNPRANLPLELS